MNVHQCPEYAEVSSFNPPGSSWEYSSSDEQADSFSPFDPLKQDNAGGAACIKVIPLPEDTEGFEAPIPGAFERNAKLAHCLRDAIELESSGLVIDALDVVYNRVADVIRFGWIEHLDLEIGEMSPDEIGTDVILGILTATLPVKSQLPSRYRLLKSAKRVLKARGHYERGILDGLQ